MLRKILREHAQRSWGFLPEQGDNQRGISLFGSRPPPLFFQLFFDMYGKAMEMPNNFNIFPNNLRAYIVMHDAGCGEYRPKLTEIYGGSVQVRSFSSNGLRKDKVIF